MNMQLFTFPYAGGNRFSFNPMLEYLGKQVKLIQMDYPGRNGGGLPLTDIRLIADYVYEQLIMRISEPFAFFAHSMGTTVAYLVMRQLLADGRPLPVHMFMSGRMGPSFPFLREAIYKLPREQFISELKKFNGIPAELYGISGAVDYFIPLLRADFEAVEQYLHKQVEPVNIPISVFYGNQEAMDERLLLASWQRETEQVVSLCRFQGNHFYITANWETISLQILNELKQYR